MTQRAWIRDWHTDRSTYFDARNSARDEGADAKGQRDAGKAAQLEFRQEFSVDVFDAESGGAVVDQLAWGALVEVPADSLRDSTGGRIAIEFSGDDGAVAGWVQRKFVAHARVVGREADDAVAIQKPERMAVSLRKSSTSSSAILVKLLWGDRLQALKYSGEWVQVYARGWLGWIHEDDVSVDPLLEVYFIDVGQGDGVLVCDPDGRHILVDGGLPRSHQQTGKNAADFVDWKFFVDYGETDIRIDAMVASHCDKDHYGGLDDLVSTTKTARDERDTDKVHVSKLFHAGLSYWVEEEGEEKTLGPGVDWDGIGLDAEGTFSGKTSKPARVFTRLLDEAGTPIEDLLEDDHEPHLAGDWQTFLKRATKTGAALRRLGLPFESATDAVFMEGWDAGEPLSIRVLGPMTLEGSDGPTLPDFGSTSQNTNGHSVLLRLDYGQSRILLTGDLNRNSMQYLLRGLAGHEVELASDVAKGCHHGSDDISYRFLEQVEAGATVISSGDSEGYGHPRPEVVGASAVTGHLSIDEEEDALLTPLIYSTEVERGVSLGRVKHLSFSKYPVEGADDFEGSLFGTRPSSGDLRGLHDDLADHGTRATFTHGYFKGVWTRKTGTKDLRGARILERVNYGLVNVRTDGDLIMCATQTDSGQGWKVHVFPARPKGPGGGA